MVSTTRATGAAATRCSAPSARITLPAALRVRAAIATWPRTAARGRGEVGGLVERADLGLVGEEDVDVAVDELAKGRAVAPDAERVGEAERHLAPGGVGDRTRPCGTPPAPAADRKDSPRDR